MTASVISTGENVLSADMSSKTEVSAIRLEHREGTVQSEEQVGSILERDATATIADWLSRVKRDDELSRIVLSDEERTGHLPKLIRELVHRLRVPRGLGTKQTPYGWTGDSFKRRKVFVRGTGSKTVVLLR